MAVARELGETLASRNITVVYGGARVGLMGAVADAALAGGGHVMGVIPEDLLERAGHDSLTELHVVDTMHTRKALMYDSADAFVILPGGIGTLDEFAEIVAWSTLAIHNKPIGLVNLHGYFDPLLAFLDQAVTEQFLKAEYRALVVTAGGVGELLEKLQNYEINTCLPAN